MRARVTAKSAKSGETIFSMPIDDETKAALKARAKDTDRSMGRAALVILRHELGTDGVASAATDGGCGGNAR